MHTQIPEFAARKRLLPCSCGRFDCIYIVEVDDLHRIRCTKCGFESSPKKTPRLAVADWNGHESSSADPQKRRLWDGYIRPRGGVDLTK